MKDSAELAEKSPSALIDHLMKIKDYLALCSPAITLSESTCHFSLTRSCPAFRQPASAAEYIALHFGTTR